MVATDMLESVVTDTHGKQFVSAIRTSAQHGAALVRQLLAFARGAVGQHTELSLPALLNDFISFVGQTFPRTVEISLETAPDIWAVRGDATQLKQVLVNLCLNARDAMPAGGKITIRLENKVLSPTEARDLRELKPGPHVVIHVGDTGTGMTPAVLDKIFDPFFTTKEVGKGTGLGLAAVRGIVKGHGGSVAVDSIPNRGTTFRIYLPAIAATPPETGEPTREQKSGGKGEGVLLVDDESGVRNILTALLTASGFNVLKASSGREALEVFSNRSSEIALVLTDVMMADGDGFSLVENLHAQKANVPIVMMSGLAGGGHYEERAKRLGVPLLPKPVTREILIRSVNQALSSHAA
jgi:CheY-like chemotaxis protein